MSFLAVEQLTKTWQGTNAVDGIDFSIRQGEFVALLGPSGCGKSTILKMIAGLETPSSGKVIIQGRNVTQFEPGDRQLSMVFQSYALFPHLSVKENILFGLKARKVSKREQQARFASVIELVNLHQQIDKKPAQLSGGQCQRVALARSIVSQSPICLMDEPLSNLDAKLRGKMRTEIRALQKKLGLTVIYVTHDQVEAMSMADRIILLNAGAIEQMGAPSELYSNPQSTFVANFIGGIAMNLLRGERRTIGIRAECIQVNFDQPVDCEEQYQARVIDCDYQGLDSLLKVELITNAAQQTVFNLSLPGLRSELVGKQIYLGWQRHDQHVFTTDGRYLPIIN